MHMKLLRALTLNAFYTLLDGKYTGVRECFCFHVSVSECMNKPARMTVLYLGTIGALSARAVLINPLACITSSSL